MSSSSNGAIGIFVEYGTAGDASDFDSTISSTDLINNGSSTLSSVSSTPLVALSNLTDGTALSTAVRDEDFASPSEYSATIVFNVDLSINTLGYNLSSLSTFAGLGVNGDPVWYDRYHEFAHQSYTIAYSLVGDPAFADFATVSAVASFGDRSSKVTLTALSGDVPGGVDAIRFTWLDPVPSIAASTEPTGTITGIREIDVFGSAVPIPEPGSALLLSLAFVTVLRRRRGNH